MIGAKMKKVLILLCILFIASCSDITQPNNKNRNFEGNWKSESVTIISRNGITVNNLPENFQISLILNRHKTFELIRKAENFIFKDSGDWLFVEENNTLLLSCENGVVYSLLYISSESRLKYNSTEFIEMELFEINASLTKLN